MSYKIQFIDNIRFVESLLSRLADNFTKVLYKGKCTIVCLILNIWQRKRAQ